MISPFGTPLVAVVSGDVTMKTNALGGNVIWIDDTDQHFVLYYAHLDRYAKGIKQGDRVTRGTVLGYVGTTGNAPPDVPHLHFQLMRIIDMKKWWNGPPLNPLPFLVSGVALTRAGLD